MHIKLNPETPQERNIQPIVDILKNDGVIIYPIDTVYAFGCSILSKKGKEKIYHLKKLDPKDPLTFICNDISQFEAYVLGLTTSRYRVLKKIGPSRITFIFKASKKVPKVMLSKRSTIGVRIPDASIPLKLSAHLGFPILSSSIPTEEGDDDMRQNPDLIHEKYEKLVDCVVDGGDLNLRQSAIIDLSGERGEVIREGDVDLTLAEPLL